MSRTSKVVLSILHKRTSSDEDFGCIGVSHDSNSRWRSVSQRQSLWKEYELTLFSNLVLKLSDERRYGMIILARTHPLDTPPNSPTFSLGFDQEENTTSPNSSQSPKSSSLARSTSSNQSEVSWKVTPPSPTPKPSPSESKSGGNRAFQLSLSSKSQFSESIPTKIPSSRLYNFI